MNERIKELANEALLYVSDRDSPGTIEINRRLEKFAELIVRECIGLIVKDNDGEEYGTGSDWGDGYTAGLNTAKLAIEEHFEIKEN